MIPIYARIIKIDEKSRTVTGRAADETVDKSNEVFDYETSVPHFQAWSAEMFKDSGGKSYGNIRSMHGSTAAGKITDIQFNDADKAIDIAVKVIDNNEWQKCLEGVHTGFSIGGSYAKKWAEVQGSKMITRYTAVPCEISLVDRPANPTAKFFSLTKRDGTVVRRRFATVQPTTDVHRAAVDAIRKVHANGPQRSGGGPTLSKNASLGEMAKFHAKKIANSVAALATGGPRAYGDGVGANSLAAIRKATAAPNAIRGLPMNSTNGTNGDADPTRAGATTGVAGYQAKPSATPTRLGPTHASYFSAPSPTTQREAVLEALKADLSKPKRWGAR